MDATATTLNTTVPCLDVSLHKPPSIAKGTLLSATAPLTRLTASHLAAYLAAQHSIALVREIWSAS